MDDLNTNHILRDDESGKLLVVVDFGGELFFKFDNLKTSNEGTFKKIDEFKTLKT